MADKGGCCVRMRSTDSKGERLKVREQNGLAVPMDRSRSEGRARPPDIVITLDTVYPLPRITAVNIGYYCMTDGRLDCAGIIESP